MNNEMNRLDSTLKESAANFELQFNEEAWNLMNEKLDADYSENKKGKRKFIIVLLGALAFLVGGYSYFYNVKTNKISVVVDNKKVNTIKQLDNINNIKNEKNIVNNLKSNNNYYFLNKKSDLNITEKQNNITKDHINEASDKLSNSITTKKLAKIEESYKNIENKKSIDYQINKNTINNKITNKKIANIEVPDLATNSMIDKSVSNKSNSKKTDRTLELLANKSTKTVNDISAAQLHKKYIANYKKAERDATKNPIPDLSVYESSPIQLLPVYSEIPLANRWYIGGSVGANISYVYKPCISDAKFTYNLILGFNITNQVGFQTGIRFGNKQFDVRKGKFSYNGPNPIWDKYIRQAHTNIDAYEIPLLVRYQFSEKPNTGLFCTAGFSVMFYQKEDYLLTLDYGNGIPVYKPYNFSKSNTELTMFNASLGYQFPLNKQLTLTAEQYISLPTTNIGNAGMRMSSTGFQLGVRYNFLKK